MRLPAQSHAEEGQQAFHVCICFTWLGMWKRGGRGGRMHEACTEETKLTRLGKTSAGAQLKACVCARVRAHAHVFCVRCVHSNSVHTHRGIKLSSNSSLMNTRLTYSLMERDLLAYACWSKGAMPGMYRMELNSMVPCARDVQDGAELNGVWWACTGVRWAGCTCLGCTG